MTIKQIIRKHVENALKKAFDIKTDNIPINYPDKREFGDYATPVCLSLARELKQKPRDIAEKLKTILETDDMFAKVEIAGPGFVNFFLSDAFLESELREIVADPRFGQNDTLAGRKILLEYVSANPTGPLHIGHGRWAAIGDSMARILRFCGADVLTEFYVNDAGNQVENLRKSVTAAKNGQPIPEDGYHGDYIKEIAESMSKNDDPVQLLLADQQKTLDKFRVDFDNYFSELSLRDSGYVDETIAFLKANGYTYEQDGALWFRTTDYGDDKDRVLVKSDGKYTYFAVDISYHRKKIARGYPELINVLGADHHGYVGRMNAAISIFGDNASLQIIIGQLVNLFRDGEPVRMSKRTGDMISLDEVIDEIGVDASRYFLVMRKTSTHLDFDLAEAKKQSDDNPVFYIQYASARIGGILRNAEEQGATYDSNAAGVNDSPEARDVILELIKFPETVADIAEALEPHRVPQYLDGLAGAFHRFYHHHRVLGEAPEVTARRLAIVKAMQNVIRSGLGLIGVDAPERM